MFATLYMFIPYNDIWSWERVKEFRRVDDELLRDLVRGFAQTDVSEYDEIITTTYTNGIYRLVTTEG